MAAGATSPAVEKSAHTSPQGEMITVEMAKIHLALRLTDHLVAYGLGACIGICLYDPPMKVAGLAHVVLPHQQQYSTAAIAQIAASTPQRFVDSALPLLVEDICHAGGERKNLRAAIVGGAHIFGGLTGQAGQASSLEIGDRNVAAARDILKEMGIPLYAADVGGTCGRTVVFRVCDGAVIVKPVGGEARVLTILSKASQEVSI